MGLIKANCESSQQVKACSLLGGQSRYMAVAVRVGLRVAVVVATVVMTTALVLVLVLVVVVPMCAF